MSKKLDITEHHLMVLSLFTRGYDSEYYIREVCRHLPMSHGTAQSVLHSLEKRNVLASVTKGKTRLFRLTNSTEASQYCKFCELYKRLIFISEQIYAGEILERMHQYIDGMYAVFGSYAKGSAQEDSDLDLLIVGTYDREKTDKTAALFGMEINIQNYEKCAFESNIKTDPLLREIMKDHVIFGNVEYFVDSVVK